MEEITTPSIRERRPYLCPKCNSKLTERIRRGFWVKAFLFWRPVKRFYCYNCKARPYIYD